MDKPYLPPPKPKSALYGRYFLLTLEVACLGMLIGLTQHWGIGFIAIFVLSVLCWSMILNIIEVVTLSVKRYRRLPNWALLLGEFVSIGILGFLMFIAYWIIAESLHDRGEGEIEVDPNEGMQLDEEKAAAADARVRMAMRLQLAESILWIMMLIMHICFFIRISVDSCIQRRSRRWQAGFKQFDDGDNVALETLPSDHERIASPELAADPHHARTLHKRYDE